MKRALRFTQAFYLIFCLSTCLFLTPFTFAQGNDDMPSVWLISEEIVKTGMDSQYRQAAQRRAQLAEEDGYDYTVYASKSLDADSSYFYFIPLDELGDLEEFHEEHTKFVRGHSEAMQSLISTVEKTNTMLTLYRSELSYIPNNPKVQGDEIRAVRHVALFAKPDRVAELEQQIKKYNDLLKEKKSPHIVHTFQSLIGAEGPLYILAQYASSSSGIENVIRESIEITGEEGRPVREAAEACLRDAAATVVTILPELGHIAD